MSFNYSPEGRGFTVPQPLEDRTLPLPIVKDADPAPIMAAPADRAAGYEVGSDFEDEGQSCL